MKVTSYRRSFSGGMGQRLWFLLQPGSVSVCVRVCGSSQEHAGRMSAAARRHLAGSCQVRSPPRRQGTEPACRGAGPPQPGAPPAGCAHVKKPWKRAKPQEPPHWMELEKRTVMGSSASICGGSTSGEASERGPHWSDPAAPVAGGSPGAKVCTHATLGGNQLEACAAGPTPSTPRHCSASRAVPPWWPCAACLPAQAVVLAGWAGHVAAPTLSRVDSFQGRSRMVRNLSPPSTSGAISAAPRGSRQEARQ